MRVLNSDAAKLYCSDGTCGKSPLQRGLARNRGFDGHENIWLIQAYELTKVIRRDRPGCTSRDSHASHREGGLHATPEAQVCNMQINTVPAAAGGDVEIGGRGTHRHPLSSGCIA